MSAPTLSPAESNAPESAAGPGGALRFDNSFQRLLPADSIADNRRRQVIGACYSRVQPEPVPEPRLVLHSQQAAELIGLCAEDLARPELVEALAGNRLLEGMSPHAACYGGHQFGSWAGQLGDGRAITLGEVLNAGGERWELQLKGAGPTPYSRTADGRAVMRSSLREFLCSEAMFHLGVPTTRALSLVATGQQIVRDMFYDGNPRAEPGAIVCRMAPSFLRFGNFEIFAARDDLGTLEQLATYLLRHHYPELGEGERGVVALFEEICRRTAVMVAGWMRVGFVHGVMNTDNMSALGLTIDYGPYGWLEAFDPLWTPNTTDAAGRRYRYGQQPQVALWNLARLAMALAPLLSDPQAQLQPGLQAYQRVFHTELRRCLHDKLGLLAPEGEQGAWLAAWQAGPAPMGISTLEPLIDDLLQLLVDACADMTLFFRTLGELAEGRRDGDGGAPELSATFYERDGSPNDIQPRLAAWLERYWERVAREGQGDAARRARMHATNPKYVLRNSLAQLAIDDLEQKGDAARAAELLHVLRRPYEDQAGKDHLAQMQPAWARNRPGCSMLSCSS